MDDFRVGSVPSSEPYGDRHPYDSVARKRPKHHNDHHDDEHGEPEEDTTDTFEVTAAGENPAPAAVEAVEDYYLPSAPAPDEE